MRSGSESSERYAAHNLSVVFYLTIHPSVKALELQVAEVEGEMEALSHSLESQKIRTSEVAADGKRRADELSKDLQKRVSGFYQSTSW